MKNRHWLLFLVLGIALSGGVFFVLRRFDNPADGTDAGKPSRAPFRGVSPLDPLRKALSRNASTREVQAEIRTLAQAGGAILEDIEREFENADAPYQRALVALAQEVGTSQAAGTLERMLQSSVRPRDGSDGRPAIAQAAASALVQLDRERGIQTLERYLLSLRTPEKTRRILGAYYARIATRQDAARLRAAIPRGEGPLVDAPTETGTITPSPNGSQDIPPAPSSTNQAGDSGGSSVTGILPPGADPAPNLAPTIADIADAVDARVTSEEQAAALEELQSASPDQVPHYLDAESPMVQYEAVQRLAEAESPANLFALRSFAAAHPADEWQLSSARQQALSALARNTTYEALVEVEGLLEGSAPAVVKLVLLRLLQVQGTEAHLPLLDTTAIAEGYPESIRSAARAAASAIRSRQEDAGE